MRVIVVLAILTLAMVAMALLRTEREASFDYRFEQAEERIDDLAKDIEQDLESE